MKHVIQLHCSSCGAACVAIVAGVSYNTALRAMFPGRVRGFASTYGDLRRTLTALTFPVEANARRCTSFGRIAEPSIVLCRYSVAANTGHWAVYDPVTGRLHDPAKPLPLVLTIAQLDRRYRPRSRLIVGGEKM